MSSSSKAENSEILQPATEDSTTPELIAVTLTLVVVCFVGFSIVYFCRCCFIGFIHTWAFQRSISGTFFHLSPNASPDKGLDPSLLKTFPTFLYAKVKDLHKEKNYSLECAICLVEFEEDSMLRLLTICCHVFHQDCIDLWLCSHNTCPVCRMNLDSLTDEMLKSHEPCEEDNDIDNVGVEEERRGDDVCIEVKEGESDQRHNDDDEGVSMSMQHEEQHKFARSHSTGHSIVMIRGGDEGKDYDDKYRLRLQEHVASKFVRGRHNFTKSCSSYKDMDRAMPAASCSNCGYV